MFNDPKVNALSIRKVVCTIAYAPPIPWWVLIVGAGGGIIEQHEHFQKGSYRNRMEIAGPQGKQRLSIPLQQGKHQKTPIREVQISFHDRWPEKHWQALQTAYGKTPYFEYYAPTLKPLFEEPPTRLWPFNISIIQWIARQLHWSARIPTTNAFGSPPHAAYDARPLIKPGQLWPAPPGVPPITYHQAFQERNGFIPDLSILDLLFHHGPETLWLLRQAAAMTPLDALPVIGEQP